MSTDGNWAELLSAGRAFHDEHAPSCAGCPLCAALKTLEAPPSLFDDGPPAHDANALGGFRAADLGTSRKAAIFNYPRSGNQRHRILLAIIAAGARGLSTDELTDGTQIPYVSASARVTELRRGGWIEDSGVERETRLGSDAIVWRATPKGIEAAAEHGDRTPVAA